jgi:hypothetical protein
MRTFTGKATVTASQMLRLGELRQEDADAMSTYEKILSGEIAKINEMAKEVPQVTVGGGKSK